MIQPPERRQTERSACFEFCSCHRLQSRIIFPNGGQRCGWLGSELGFSRILTGGIPPGLKLLTLIVIWYAKINRRMAVMTFSLLNLYVGRLYNFSFFSVVKKLSIPALSQHLLVPLRFLNIPYSFGKVRNLLFV